jgi:hypothetical protein
VHPLAQPRGNLGFRDDPSAQRRRGIAPKNIATFNTQPEALEPMAGALWTSYDTSFPAIWVEAMKKPSRAGGEPAKARPHSALMPRGRNAPKPQSNRAQLLMTHSLRSPNSSASYTRRWSRRLQRFLFLARLRLFAMSAIQSRGEADMSRPKTG